MLEQVIPATWYFVSFDDEGWAAVCICDELGMVSVQSDWLDGCYRWPSRNLPEKMTTTKFFSTTAGGDYLASKLFRNEKEVWSEPASLESFKKAIVEARREEEIDKDEAREAWDALDELTEDNVPDPLDRFNSDWYCMKYRPSSAYQTMVDKVLPALRAVVRKEVELEEARAPTDLDSRLWPR